VSATEDKFEFDPARLRQFMEVMVSLANEWRDLGGTFDDWMRGVRNWPGVGTPDDYMLVAQPAHQRNEAQVQEIIAAIAAAVFQINNGHFEALRTAAAAVGFAEDQINSLLGKTQQVSTGGGRH
jgi:hypothetical protein